MNGPKVVNAAPGGREVDGASGYMLESLSIWWYSRLRQGYGVASACLAEAASGEGGVKIHPVQIISREVQL